MKIPREDYPQVKEILDNPALTTKEKAERIHNFDYYMACMETDGRLSMFMSVEGIMGLLEERKMIEKNDIIQIVDRDHPWFPSILIVDEVKSWGVQAFLMIPNSNEKGKLSFAYNRLEYDQIEKVGTSVFAID